MVRLVTNYGRPVPVTEVRKPTREPSPNELLDILCQRSFAQRRQYISFLSDKPPFDKERAFQIMTIMINKGMSDPIAFALGQALHINWHKFEGIK